MRTHRADLAKICIYVNQKAGSFQRIRERINLNFVVIDRIVLQNNSCVATEIQLDVMLFIIVWAKRGRSKTRVRLGQQ